jgi:hypothetical protein
MLLASKLLLRAVLRLLQPDKLCNLWPVYGCETTLTQRYRTTKANANSTANPNPCIQTQYGLLNLEFSKTQIYNSTAFATLLLLHVSPRGYTMSCCQLHSKVMTSCSHLMLQIRQAPYSSDVRKQSPAPTVPSCNVNGQPCDMPGSGCQSPCCCAAIDAAAAFALMRSHHTSA